MTSEYDGRVGSVRGPAVPLLACRGSGVARCDSAVFLRHALGRPGPGDAADIQVSAAARALRRRRRARRADSAQSARTGTGEISTGANWGIFNWR